MCLRFSLIWARYRPKLPSLPDEPVHRRSVAKRAIELLGHNIENFTFLTEYGYFALEFFDAVFVFTQGGLTATAEDGAALRDTGLGLTNPAVQEVRVKAEVSSDLAGVRTGLCGELDGLLLELGGEVRGVFAMFASILEEEPRVYKVVSIPV